MMINNRKTISNNKHIYIVLGTRAQFIKVAPLMRKMLNKNIAYTLIYTSQHRENIEEILTMYQLPQPDILLYYRGEANTRWTFIRWFIDILYKVIFHSKKYISDPGLLLTHGDTFTTWLSALMGKRAGCVVGHIESGFRSFNIFSPFPEEISRLITFHIADIFFCTDKWAIGNLSRFRGQKINIGANTILDGVRYAIMQPYSKQYDFQGYSYAVVSIHRYENIFTSRFTRVIIPMLFNIARSYHLVFVLHPTTRERLVALNLYDELVENENITVHERFNFVDWINICNNAKFVITDGGSNQEELSYLGVPTLLFRNETERREGLGENVVISKFNESIIVDFMKNLEKFRRHPSLSDLEPSERIIEAIHSLFSGHLTVL